MKLTKMHGLGNDFILFADPQGASKDYTDLAIRLCDRRTGIGADGLAILVQMCIRDRPYVEPANAPAPRGMMSACLNTIKRRSKSRSNMEK